MGTPLSRSWLRAAMLAGAAALALPGMAMAQGPESKAGEAQVEAVQEKRAAADSAAADTDVELLSPSARALVDPGHQHGGDGGHLPPVSRNIDLVSKLSPTAPFGDIVEGQIADLSVHDDLAVLNSWAEEICTRGGVYLVDIKNPRRPKEAGLHPRAPRQLPRRGRAHHRREDQVLQGSPARGEQ